MMTERENITYFSSAEAMKRADNVAINERGISSLGLVRVAAKGIFEAASRFIEGKENKKAAVFSGSGNNGADGIAVAILLAKAGVKTDIWLTGSKVSADTAVLIEEAEALGVSVSPFEPESARRSVQTADVIIDAMFGIGLHSPLRGAALEAAGIINECGVPVVAADIPSGVHADTGRILGEAVKADVTVTFSHAKPGLFLEPGCEKSGQVRVWDIGIPEDILQSAVLPLALTDEEFVKEHLPRRRELSHKGDYGKALIIAGSRGFTGAPYMAALAAVRSGAGLVWLGVPECAYPVLAARCTSSMPFPLPDDGESSGVEGGGLTLAALPYIEKKLAGANVCLLGPGLGQGIGTRKLARTLIRETTLPMVVDADGINSLKGHIDILDEAAGPRVLTPHEGEFARLGGDVTEEGRLRTALGFAERHRCVLLLKGHRTVIAAPDGRAFINTTGNSGMAKGGSGDVLSGLITSLIAQGAAPFEAAVMAAWIHGAAADLTARRLSPYTMTPPDVVDDFAQIFNML